MKVFRLGIAMIVLSTLLIWRPSRAQSQIAGEIIEEGVEQIFAKAASKEIEDLTALGGKAAVRDILKKSSREGGEPLVKKVTAYGIEEGPMALKVIERAPAIMVKALDDLPAPLRAAALYAADRDPEIVTAMVGKFGSGALEVFAEHPGVGVDIVQKLGADGVALGRRLTTDQTIILARNADAIAALPPAERASVVRKILSSPAVMMDYLENKPNILKTVAGLTAFLAVKDNILGDTQGHPGLIDRLASQTNHLIAVPVMIITGVLAAGIAAWFAIHLWGKWQTQKRLAIQTVRSDRRASETSGS